MAIKVSVIAPPKNRISIKGTEQKNVRIIPGGVIVQGGAAEEAFPTGDYGYFSETDYDEFGILLGQIYDCNEATVLKTVDLGVL